MREALFSALESVIELEGVRVLDLYAGSGALGLEALSRGASHALFVENDPAVVKILRRNVATLAVAGAQIRHGRARAVLAERPEPSMWYDVVLADPPYAMPADELDAMLTALSGYGWITEGSLVVVERDVRGDPPNWPKPLHAVRSTRYGDTVLHWARHEDE